MSILGTYSKLEVSRVAPHGVYLQSGADLILLPKSAYKDKLEPGDWIEVFVYRDAEGRLIATPQRPLLLAGECGFLEAKENAGFGTFMNWGISKDLLIPFNEQKVDLVEGRKYLVYVFVDEKTEKLIGSTIIQDFIHNDDVELNAGDEVDILIIEKTDIGYKTVINNKHHGLLYENEVFQPLNIGDRLKAFIKLIRPDRKIDLSLQRSGYDEISGASEKILKVLSDKNGFLPLHDKSDPQEIYDLLGISKKVFKKAIGSLYKERKISVEDNGIRLL